MPSDDYYRDIEMMQAEVEEPSLKDILDSFRSEAVWYDWAAFILAIPFMIVLAITMVPINFIDRK